MYKQNHKGFTLAEVVIAVAIVGILAAIAIPAYTDHVRKSRRADGTISLLNAAHQLERCGSAFGRYDHANCANLLAAQDSTEAFYSIAGVAAAATYTFTATAQNEQVSDAAKCDAFTVDQAGTKGATGSEGIERCWNS